jgi:hypothetical protein
MKVFESTGCSTGFSIVRYTAKFSSSTSNESKTISLLFCLSDLLQGAMRNVIALRSCLTLDTSFTVWDETSGTLDIFTARHTKQCAVSPSTPHKTPHFPHSNLVLFFVGRKRVFHLAASLWLAAGRPFAASPASSSVLVNRLSNCHLCEDYHTNLRLVIGSIP